MLFYMRDSDSLEAAVAQATAASPEAPSKSSSSIGKKRAREDDDIEEDTGRPVCQAFLSSSGAGPSNPAAGKKVSGMLPKQDRPPEFSHLAKPSLSRPPHNRLPASEDEKEEVESPQFHKKAKLNVGVAFNGVGHRAEGKKKKKKRTPQGNIIKLSSFNLSGKQPSLDLPNVSSDPDHEEEELGTSDPANTATILSTPPLPPSTPPTADKPSPAKKRKLVDYSSEGENGPTDGEDAPGDHRSRRPQAASPASPVSSAPEQRETASSADAMLPDLVPGSMFGPSLSPQQRQQWNTAYRPKKQKYASEHKREQKRKSLGNPYALAGHPSGGSASIGGSIRRRPGGI